MKAVDKKTGKVAVKGDAVVDFRGDTSVFLYASRVNEAGGRDGKVCVKAGECGEREFYARVFGLEVLPD